MIDWFVDLLIDRFIDRLIEYLNNPVQNNDDHKSWKLEKAKR